MLTFNEYKEGKNGNSLLEDATEDVFVTPDRTKSISAINVAIGQIQPIVTNLTDIATKLDAANVNSSKLKTISKSLETYITQLKEAASKPLSA